MVFILVYCDIEIIFFVIVNVVVIFGNGRDVKLSEFIEFIYKFKFRVNLLVEEVEMYLSFFIIVIENVIIVDLFNFMVE